MTASKLPGAVRGGRAPIGPQPILLALALAALSACTATTASPGPQSTPLRAAAPATDQTAALPAPVRLAEARVAFAPLVGAPQNIADWLAEAVARQSAAHGLTLAPFGDGQADYTIKGYLSAEATSAGTTRAVYVWDVLDRDLKRLHRVSGEAISPVTAAEPWAAIDGGTLEEMARQTVGALAAWMTAG